LYGPTVRIAPDELSFTNPSAWPQIYNSRPQLAKTDYHFTPSGETNNLPESMITASDAEHTRLRRLAGPAFLNSGIAEVEPVLQHYVDLLCSQLTLASAEGSQDMGEWFLWALNDVIGQLALDQKFECLAKRRMHPWPSYLLNVLKQSAAVNQFRRYGVTLKMLKPLMSKQAIADANGFINSAKNAVNKRLAKEDVGDGPESGHKDIIGLMLREIKGGEKLTKEEVTANSVLIVGGGAETTSTCLSATLYHLCNTPRVMKKLRDQIREQFASPEQITLKAVGDMAYLKATIDESLRMYPVASYITPRVTPKGGHVIDGEVVPAGVSTDTTNILRTSTNLTYRHTSRWANGPWADHHTSSMTPMSSGPNAGSTETCKRLAGDGWTTSSSHSAWVRGIVSENCKSAVFKTQG
jgi:cytochrome P450